MAKESSILRRTFARVLFQSLKVVWPILSGLVGLVMSLGIWVGSIEGWRWDESLYFSFVTGLTIGYGEFVPKTLLSRALSVLIGLCGILTTALLAALAVKALTAALNEIKA